MRATPILIMTLALVLGACTVPAPTTAPQTPAPAATSTPPRVSSGTAVRNFNQMVGRMEPVIERICRQETPRQNCDFIILVDNRPQSGVNAFQTVNRRGQPVIVFTAGLITEARNIHELAFVMGHEAGHHIARHLAERRTQATVGAVILGEIVRRQGGSSQQINQAARIGSTLAARQFSQSAELEADSLGTIIAYRAGYDPLIGAAFFQRLPEPSNRFLSTHPPNAQRINMVRRTMQQIQRQGS